MHKPFLCVSMFIFLESECIAFFFSVPPKEKNKKTNIKNSQYKVTREESLGPNAEKYTLKKKINVLICLFFGCAGSSLLCEGSF